MALWQYALILGAGLVAGFVNAMAGGGSLLTLPALMVGGMPSLLANGSNRLGILSQGMAAMLSFRRKGVLVTLRDWLHAIPVVVGGLVGAYFAGQVQARVMDVVIAVVLIAMCGMLFVNPKRWKPRVYTEQGRAWREVLMVTVFLLAGFYGGFIQVGVGYMFLFTLIFLEGKDLITANAIKGLIMFVFTTAIMPVYIYQGLVEWLPAILLAVGTSVGGWIGAQVAVKRGVNFIRWIMVGTVGVFCLKLLFF